MQKKKIAKYILLAAVLGIAAGIGIKTFSQSALGRAKESVGDVVIGTEGKVAVVTRADLEDIFEISELSVIDYTYNAIARAYEEDGVTPKYYVAYEGSVTAGIDFSKIQIDISDENKVVNLTLPDCTIQKTTVDFGSMEYIFTDKKYEDETISHEAYELCKSDIQQRAAYEEELLKLARENAISSVRAWVEPWIEQIDNEYQVNIN
ncbi:MAG: DUF4230 domain-containing protein [Muribaculaceae bacterium]|nr:DUF4230 domain-containing protein [Muribaculaceae bacterium]MCM1491664.1 DUF4230 domain-containing protein [Muribaculaceae bacterium]